MKKIKSKTKMKTKMNKIKKIQKNTKIAIKSNFSLFKSKNKDLKITGKESMHEVIQKHPEVAMILMENGMGCCGCPMAANESINDGCISHGINPKQVVEKINKIMEKK